MCEYCKQRKENEIMGKYFNLLPTAGFKNDRKYDSWIMKNKADKKAGIMITTDNGNAVYFDINYCPMCRKEIKRGRTRKMNKEEEDILKDSKDFFKFIHTANEVCVERGKFYDFECPLCKGRAKAIKSSYNGHLHAECKQCDMLVME